MNIIKQIFKDKILLLFAVVIMISLGFAVKNTFDFLRYNVNVKSLNESGFEVSELKNGDACEGGVQMVLDMIASNDDESIAYYLTLIHNDEYEGYCVVKTETMQTQFNDMCKHTLEYFMGEIENMPASLHFIADVCEADSNIIRYAEEWFDDDENAEAKQYLCPYMLVQREYSFEYNIIILIISAVIFIGAIIGMLIYRKKKYDSE